METVDKGSYSWVRPPFTDAVKNRDDQEHKRAVRIIYERGLPAPKQLPNVDTVVHVSGYGGPIKLKVVAGLFIGLMLGLPLGVLFAIAIKIITYNAIRSIF